MELRCKADHDSKYKTNIIFKPGDRALLIQPGRVNKMDMPCVGPYRILYGDRILEIDLLFVMSMGGGLTNFMLAN